LNWNDYSLIASPLPADFAIEIDLAISPGYFKSHSQTGMRKKNLKERAVLFVDDEEISLQALERSLRDEQYNRYYAGSAEEALEILRREEVHVVVVDIIMPGMGGLELLRIVRKEYPNIIRIALSGYTQSTDVTTTMYGEGIYFIPKPWTLDDDLRKAIRRAIDNYNLQIEHEEIVAELEFCSSRKKSME
jgi:DNA-binding NtrC family response regulator